MAATPHRAAARDSLCAYFSPWRRPLTYGHSNCGCVPPYFQEASCLHVHTCRSPLHTAGSFLALVPHLFWREDTTFTRACLFCPGRAAVTCLHTNTALPTGLLAGRGARLRRGHYRNTAATLRCARRACTTPSGYSPPAALTHPTPLPANPHLLSWTGLHSWHRAAHVKSIGAVLATRQRTNAARCTLPLHTPLGAAPLPTACAVASHLN